MCGAVRAIMEWHTPSADLVPQVAVLRNYSSHLFWSADRRVKRPDLLHIHAVGPAVMVPLARLFGLRVVVTHHGADYEREKWGGFAKFILRAGEACGMLFGHQRIAISQVIRHFIKHKYSVDCEYIPNGTELPELPTTRSALTEFGLQPQKYVLMVGRLVPEKRQADLIAAFNKAALMDGSLFSSAARIMRRIIRGNQGIRRK